jgi:predicted RNase H-like nuclease
MHQRTLDDLVVVGVDCATQPGKVGLARLDVIDGRPTITEACTGAAGTDLAEVVGGWLNARSLIALDAPLGWPKALGERLALHRAGEPLAATADEMFSRATDRKMVEMVGKRPLEVGADRIARTAHAALQFLEQRLGARGVPGAR